MSAQPEASAAVATRPAADEYAGHVIVITGGTSGIGADAALACARLGMRVVVAGRRDDRGRAIAEKIRSLDGTGIFVRADVSREGDVRDLMAEACQAYGRIDYAFNNAGVSCPGNLSDVSIDDFDRAFSINARGVWLCMKHERAAMSGGGVIVNTTSVHAFRTVFPGIGAYVASKHTAAVLTKVAALEYARDSIRVNAIAPGPIDTEMLRTSQAGSAWQELIPQHRIGSTDDVIGCLLFLLSDRSSYITGHVLPVDGGFLAC